MIEIRTQADAVMFIPSESHYLTRLLDREYHIGVGNGTQRAMLARHQLFDEGKLELKKTKYRLRKLPNEFLLVNKLEGQPKGRLVATQRRGFHPITGEMGDVIRYQLHSETGGQLDFELFASIEQALTSLAGCGWYPEVTVEVQKVAEGPKPQPKDKTPLGGMPHKFPDYCHCDPDNSPDPNLGCGCAFGQCAKGLIF